MEFDALAVQKLLLPSLGHGLRTILEQCARDRDMHLNVRVEADSYSTLKNLIKSGVWSGSFLTGDAPKSGSAV